MAFSISRAIEAIAVMFVAFGLGVTGLKVVQNLKHLMDTATDGVAVIERIDQ